MASKYKIDLEINPILSDEAKQRFKEELENYLKSLIKMVIDDFMNHPIDTRQEIIKTLYKGKDNDE